MDKVSKVKEWIKNISTKREELGGHSICPYAFSASVHIEERSLRSVSLNSGNLVDYDVIIYIIEDDIDEAAMMQKVAELNMSQTEYLVLDDHKNESTYINGIQSNFCEHNLILIQKRDKLEKARDQLHKTNYYDYWSEQMYRRIVNGKKSDRFRK
ncbi:hypothetical protein S-PM2d077 [Synechococcus phage S-PM2]|uniref:Hypothetical-Protein / belonging to T4-LIKE GC: 824 n=1 Tax=Synechococcus phage S-PM2 TaxID=238854 RepID=Q5GQU3_BPSYP|nr:Hypothetical-Protein / belonging to T4-LIKE GC: 824 [Synechococcus phage S-PM2]CAF34141.1 Hypothetical-Protein / belonging to T4-LIKE GC: 824 [Synechococcus phage S-PM2]CFW42203.1 hypothetical protein S-PM2d077 [Synechococcus phage S-PM2]